MSQTSTLALLVPAYNASAFLPRLLESAARQTKPFDEIWVYDDCSTDDTADVARRFGAQVVRGEVNRGCSHGKNVLAQTTSAEWIHFHDADDELYPNFVSLARRWMDSDQFDVVLFPYEERDGETGRHTAYRRFDPDDVARDSRSYAIRVQINPFCGLYRRASFRHAGGYDEDPLVLYNEDVAMHIGLAFNGLSFAADTEVSIINHRYQNSMSAANRLKCLRAQYNVMRKTAERSGARQYSVEISNNLWDIAAGLASQLDWGTADDASELAVRLAGLSKLPPGRLFRSLCRISPRGALRLREACIRLFKPKLRNNFPNFRRMIEEYFT
jgi:glycosyltransferase involved in cell wall biosynthesis